MPKPLVYVAGKMRLPGDCLTCGHTRAAHTDSCSCHHTECACPNYTWYASDDPHKVPALSYDSYTEGEWVSVLQYILSTNGHHPIGRDEITERVLELVTQAKA